MHAFVYKSLRKADTYLYLAVREDVSRLPEPLAAALGPLQFVLEVELSPQRALARENPVVVMEHLATAGFHLQLPPQPGAAPDA